MTAQACPSGLNMPLLWLLGRNRLPRPNFREGHVQTQGDIAIGRCPLDSEGGGDKRGRPLSGPAHSCKRLCRAVDQQLLTWDPSNRWFLGDCTRQRASWDYRLTSRLKGLKWP